LVLKFENDTVSFFGALVLIGATATLSAAEERTSWLDAPWKFSAKGYGWLPEGSATLKIDQTEVANLPESLDNIFDSLDMGAMFEFEDESTLRVHQLPAGKEP